MALPLLALVAPDELPEPLHGLLVAIFPLARPAAYDPAIASRFRGCLLASSTQLRSAPPGLPLAVWEQDPARLEPVLAHERVRAILTTNPAVDAAAGDRAVRVPPGPNPHPDARPILPMVRSRIRAARGLPARAIAVVDPENGAATWCGEPLETEAIETAIACAAAVIAHGDALPHAMAWGAPAVTDAASGAAIGARDGHDVVIESRDPVGAAEALAGGDARSATLSWQARKTYERGFDMSRTALALARRLDFLPTNIDRVDALLSELGTPNNAGVKVRAYDCIRPFRR